MGPADEGPKDVDGELSGESMRLVRKMDTLIERSRLLLQPAGKELARPATLGGVLYAKPSHPVVPEREWISLVRSIASADRRALQALYERLGGPVETLIARITGDERAAGKLTVAVFHDVRRRAAGYRAMVDGTVVAWVMNLARAAGLAWRRGEDARFEADPRFAVDTISGSGWRDTGWDDVAPGISVKLLATDEERHMVSMLVRLVPGGEYPPHTHAGIEQLHLLEGELWIDERKLHPGDYNRAEPGTGDKRVWSETGCLCVLVTSTRDALR